MSVELDALAAQVQRNSDVEDSAILLIQGIADQLKAAMGDPAKLTALEVSLRTSATRLGEAVAANTVTPPPPPPPPPPPVV